jgi:hypothetical protein
MLTNIFKLWKRDNDIGDAGCKDLGIVLKTLVQLTTIQLDLE